jgi:hypothetical protein
MDSISIIITETESSDTRFRLKNKTPLTASVARIARSSVGSYTNDNVRELDRKRTGAYSLPESTTKG